MIESSFHYFAYGTYVDPTVLTTSLAAAFTDGSTPPTVLPTRRALLPGYRLACDAVSVEGPRLGRLNLTPFPLTPRDPSSPSLHPEHQTNVPADALIAFQGGVRGVLYELPAQLKAPLLQAVAQEGSFNVYATLPCHVESAEVERHTCDALVIAALDFPLLARRYVLPDDAAQQWHALPVPCGVAVPPGLSSAAFAGANHTAVTADAEKSAVLRWPGLHWCNCLNSLRVAPSKHYAEAVRQAYTTYLLPSPHAGEGGVNTNAVALYAKAVHDLVYACARDIDEDAAEEKTWYLAYGSNLSWEQVCLRIGPPYQRRAVQLDGYVLVANKTPYDGVKYASFGYYTVEPVETREAKKAAGAVRHVSTMPDHVCGAAYQISTAQLEMMDGFEGGYRRELLRCKDLCDVDAAPMDCWTYIALNTSEELLPSKEYLSRVLEGFDILPPAYMEAIRTTPSNPLRSPRQDQRLRKEI